MDIQKEGVSQVLYSLTDVNGTLYFRIARAELWKSDGCAAGTILVKDFGPEAHWNSYLSSLTNVGDTLYFRADDGTRGVELWKSEGTESGTVIVKDIWPGAYRCYAYDPEYGNCLRSGGSSSPRSLLAIDGTLFFTALAPVTGGELWKSDGTVEGTELVMDIIPGAGGSYPDYLTEVSGTFFFTTIAPGGGEDLWKSDGTESGTLLVRHFPPDTHGGRNPQQLTNVNGTLYFVANDGISGFELWKSDGTEDGTVLVKDIYSGVYGSHPRELTNVNGKLFFGAFEVAGGSELWMSDGTEAGTIRVKDIGPGAIASSPRYLISVNGRLFFSADDQATGLELWSSDGTEEGTVLVQDIWKGPYQCYYYRYDYGGNRYCAHPGGNSSPVPLAALDGALLFAADDGTHGRGLWKVVVEDEAVPGDTNGDGAVNVEDLNNVRNHFGETGDGVLGDTAPFDGKVDIQDLNAVRNNFGAGGGGSALHVGRSHIATGAVDRGFARIEASRANSPSHAVAAQAADVLFGLHSNDASTAPTWKSHARSSLMR